MNIYFTLLEQIYAELKGFLLAPAAIKRTSISFPLEVDKSNQNCQES